MHTDLDISWIKASLPGFISTLTSPFLKRETELTEGKVGLALLDLGRAGGLPVPLVLPTSTAPSAPTQQPVCALKGLLQHERREAVAGHTPLKPTGEGAEPASMVALN